MEAKRITTEGDVCLFNGAPHDATLDDWVEGLWMVYGQHTLLYPRMSDYWMHATNAAQNVAEEVRRGRPHELIKRLGAAFAWFCTTARKTLDTIRHLDPQAEELQKVGDSYSRWVAFKYPRCCHYCGWESCRCPSQRQVMEERNDKPEIQKKYLQIQGERPKLKPEEVKKRQAEFASESLGNQIKWFDSIYQAANFERPLDNVCFHFLEEVGEVAREISWFEALETIMSVSELRTKYETQFSTILPGKSLQVMISAWAGRALASPADGTRAAKALTDNLKDMKFEHQVRRLQQTYAVAVMTELTDVFSWTTSIDYKVRQACERVGAQPIDLPAFLCAEAGKDLAPHAYVATTAGANLMKCAYCGDKSCGPACVTERLLFEAIKKRVKQEVPL